MKYAFSTLSCPAWSFKEVITSAKDLGYDGVEVRGVSEEMYAPSVKEFRDDKIADTVSYLKSLCIEIPILSSGAEIAVPAKQEAAINEAEAYMELASGLKTPYVRILSVNSAAPATGDIALAKKTYSALCALGEKLGVTPLIETNGPFCDTAVLSAFMSEIPSDNKGILWDIHHPYRFNDESVDTTLSNIGKWVKYVHVKDSVISDGKLIYKMIGYGDVPVKDAVLHLSNIGYRGYLTLEWVKRWNKELEEPGVALCQYISYIKQY
jgi:fatty-acyl-CoA synthase